MLKLLVLMGAIFISSVTFGELAFNNSFSCHSRLGEAHLVGQLTVINKSVVTKELYYQSVTPEGLVESPLFIHGFEFSSRSLKISGITFDQKKMKDVSLIVTGDFRNNIAKGTMTIGESNFVIYDSCEFIFDENDSYRK